MSSGGWEVVGKNKKDKAGGKSNKTAKSSKKKTIDNTPKVEDFLPLSQVKTYYDNLQNGNKENKKPAKEKENKPKDNEEKKKQKQPAPNEKKKDEPKEKLPKSIEDALNAIDAKEFQELLTNGQVRYPNAPLIWLKDLVAYLNTKIPIDKDDPVFSNKPANYPLSVTPRSLRTTFEKAINASGVQNTQLFYEFLLTAMVTEMSKNTPVIGYKIAIQLLAKHDPKMASNNVTKLISLRNSYQNRKPIGMSLLWALAQSGREDLGVAIKVWHEVMTPMLEAKSYSQYAAQIMFDYLSHHESCTNLSPDMYLTVLDDVLSGKVNVPSSQTDKCAQIAEKIRKILFQNKSANYRKLFDSLMSRLTPKVSNSYKDKLLTTLLGCLVVDDNCFSSWKSWHLRNPYASHTLLKCIESNWTNLKQSMSAKLLQETLTSVLESHDPTKKAKGKDDTLLSACNKEAKALLRKMKQHEETRKRGFPWRACFYFLLFIVGAVLLVDYQKHGSIKSMRTSELVRNNKLVDYGSNAWSFATQYTNQGLKSIEKNYPEQYKKVSEQAAAYSKLTANGVVLAKNSAVKLYGNIATYVATKQPVVTAAIEDYAPGLLNTVREYSSKGLQLLTTYYAKLGEQVIEHSTMMIRWMEINVFVGKLSPESLQNYARQAINSTQELASRTYDWVYEKVQTLSNVQ